uniref:Alpha-tubulin N-acetyltransferase 1 n=1 Tax=Ascaris suum TaxID=6253 RepID=F1LDK5_ASCSU
MEVAGDLTPLLGPSLVRLDAMAVKQLQDARLYSAIDELALLSAKAMQLRQPLTTCEKLVSADNVLYLLWEKDEQTSMSRLLGMLKVGRKQLFLYDRQMKTYEVTLLAFMAKHYGLTDAVWQNTNFVVFPQLFDTITTDDGSAPEGWRRSSTPRHIGRGATDTRWLEHAITGHAAKGNSTGSPVECDSSAEGTLANRANQARLRKAHILSSKPLW